MKKRTQSNLSLEGPRSISRRTSLLRIAALAAPTVLLPRLGLAQSFPAGPIRIVVPFAGGTPPDSYCRIFGEKLSDRIGQPVIIDLRPGASTTIGTAYAAKVKPDGHTLAYLTNSSLTAAPNLFRKLQYDPEKDFSAITVMLESYFCIGVRRRRAGSGASGARQTGREPAAETVTRAIGRVCQQGLPTLDTPVDERRHRATIIRERKRR